jgi:predicted nucleic-acid-binding Zn-ribbon protein
LNVDARQPPADRASRLPRFHYTRAVRTSVRCLKCQHGEIVVLRHVAGDQVYLAADPAGGGPPIWRRAGPREAHICRACGYTEYYTREVAAIPIDGELVALRAADDPYR